MKSLGIKNVFNLTSENLFEIFGYADYFKLIYEDGDD